MESQTYLLNQSSTGQSVIAHMGTWYVYCAFGTFLCSPTMSIIYAEAHKALKIFKKCI